MLFSPLEIYYGMLIVDKYNYNISPNIINA